MRDIPPALAASLASGVTTLARCWRLTRRDGATLGFTDHDGDIAFDGVAYRAATGMTASAAESALGLAVSGLDVVGALDDSGLTEADPARGAYDGASVALYLVDWSAPQNRLMLFSGALGEVARETAAFSAELRSLTHALAQPRGRVYQRACDADLGDARCKVDLTLPERRAEGAVTAMTGWARQRAPAATMTEAGLVNATSTRTPTTARARSTPGGSRARAGRSRRSRSRWRSTPTRRRRSPTAC
jgi:uncharacterized phage protein (TIGR02218 family)